MLERRIHHANAVETLDWNVSWKSQDDQPTTALVKSEFTGIKNRSTIDGSRIRSLEGQVSAIQNTLVDLVSTLRQGMASGNNALPAPEPAMDPSPEHFQSQNVNINPFTNTAPQASPSHSTSFDPSQFNFPLQNQMFPGTMSHRSPSYSAFPPGTVNFGFPPRQDVGSDTASVNSRNQPSPYNILTTSDAARPSPQDLSTMEGAFRRPALPASTMMQNQHLHANEMSLPPSRAGSVGAEDILGPDHITNPLGAMSNMAGLVEAAVARARDDAEENSTKEKASSKRAGDQGDSSGPVKKTRFSPTEPSGPTVLETQQLPWKGSTAKGKGKAKRKHIHAYPDAVAEGLVSEEEGRELIAL